MLTNSYEGELSRRFEELDAKKIQIANEESKQYQAKEQEKIEETKKQIRKLTGKNNEPEEHHEFTEEELALMTSDNPDDSLAVDDNGNVLRLVGDVRIVPQKEVKFEDGTVIPDDIREKMEAEFRAQALAAALHPEENVSNDQADDKNAEEELPEIDVGEFSIEEVLDDGKSDEDDSNGKGNDIPTLDDSIEIDDISLL